MSDPSKQGKLVAVVIATAMVLWIGAQWIGGAIGLPDRYVFLFDFAALGAFIWAMIVAWQIWRNRDD